MKAAKKKKDDYPIIAMPSHAGKHWVVCYRNKVFTMPIEKAKTKERAAAIAFQKKNLPPLEMNVETPYQGGLPHMSPWH